MRDVQALSRPGGRASPGVAVRGLFGLRRLLGGLFGWDAPRHDTEGASYLHRLTDDDRTRSLETPGGHAGAFRLLYLFPGEALAEVHNATVHAFLATALRVTPDGYLLYWAVYVKPVGPLTRIYMALIDPFRRLVVYPALIRETQAAWSRAYPASAVRT
jgi:hypothetical protein